MTDIKTIKTVVSELSDQEVNDLQSLLIKNLAGNQKARLSHLAKIGLLKDSEVQRILLENKTLEEKVKSMSGTLATGNEHLKNSGNYTSLDKERVKFKEQLAESYKKAKKLISKSQELETSSAVGKVPGLTQYKLTSKEVDTLTKQSIDDADVRTAGKLLRDRIVNNGKN